MTYQEASKCVNKFKEFIKRFVYDFLVLLKCFVNFFVFDEPFWFVC